MMWSLKGQTVGSIVVSLRAMKAEWQWAWQGWMLAGLLPSSSVNGGIRSTSVRSSLSVSKTNSFLLIANPNPDPNPNPMTLNQTQHISLDFPRGTL